MDRRPLVVALLALALSTACAESTVRAPDAGVPPCPFALEEAACAALDGCAYAAPGSPPTLTEAGCVELRGCGDDADCPGGFVCRDIGVDNCRPTDRGCLTEVLRLDLCIPPDAYTAE